MNNEEILEVDGNFMKALVSCPFYFVVKLRPIVEKYELNDSEIV